MKYVCDGIERKSIDICSKDVSQFVYTFPQLDSVVHDVQCTIEITLIYINYIYKSELQASSISQSYD